MATTERADVMALAVAMATADRRRTAIRTALVVALNILAILAGLSALGVI